MVDGGGAGGGGGREGGGGGGARGGARAARRPRRRPRTQRDNPHRRPWHRAPAGARARSGSTGGGMTTVRGSDARRVGRLAFALVAAALSVAPSVRLSGQTAPRLRAALALVQSGRADSARALVRRLLATLPPQDSVYPEALYTQGMIAPDAASAATSLQLVVVEYGWSRWANDALLRLPQLHHPHCDPA